MAKAFPLPVPDSQRAIGVLRAALGPDPKEAIARVFQVLSVVVQPTDEHVDEVRRQLRAWTLSG